MSQKEHGEYGVRLLDHLMPIDLKIMIMEQQRELTFGHGCQIPPFLEREAVVLQMNSEALIVGQAHLICRLAPSHWLGIVKADPFGKCGVGVGPLLLHTPEDRDRVP